MAGNPVLDARPAGIAQLALVDQPAAHAAVGLLVGAGKGQAYAVRTAVGFGQVQLAASLYMQDQRVHRVGQPGDLAPGQRGACLRQGFNLLAAEPGSTAPTGQTGRRAVQRHLETGRCLAPRRQQRLEVAGQQAVGAGAVVQRQHAVGLQAFNHPAQARLGFGDAELTNLGAQRRKHRPRALAAAQPGVPGLVQAVGAQTGQLAPAHRLPAAARLCPRLGQRRLVQRQQFGQIGQFGGRLGGAGDGCCLRRRRGLDRHRARRAAATGQRQQQGQQACP